MNIEMILKSKKNINILTKNVFVGDIKECYDIKSYNIYGDYKKIEDPNERRIKNSTFDYFTDVVKEHAVLIKTGKNEYVDINKTNDNLDILLPASWKILNTSPKNNNDRYVDEKTLQPFFNKGDKVPRKIRIFDLESLIFDENNQKVKKKK